MSVAMVSAPVGEPLHTPDAIAQHLRVSRSMIYAEIKKGRLRAIYIGRLPRITASALAEYLAEAARAS
jgi:excisionase family DNA binding protein